MTTTPVGRIHPTRSLRWSCLNCGSRNLPMRDGIMSSEARPTRGTGVSPRKRLTICAIGEADSVHVATRIRCFADMGHQDYLITASRSRRGIAGVTELVPGFDAALADRGWRRALARASRSIGGETLCHLFRIFGLVRLLLRCRPDIVHVHYAYSLYGWAAGLLGCRPLVVTVMGGDVLFEEQGSPTPIGKWLTLELLRKADYITSKSHHLTEILDGFGGFADKTERILWGVPVETFRRVDASSLRQLLGIVAQRRVILSPKILRPLYRIDRVVEAMAPGPESCPDAARLLNVYVPDAGYRAAVKRRTDELRLPDHA